MSQKVMDLSVDTGSILIEIKDEHGNSMGDINIMPTDSDIVFRYEKVAEFFNNIKISENPTDEEYENICNGIKEQFDYLFDYSVSENIFSKCGPLTIITNGDFFFEDVMIKLCGIVEKITDQRIKKKIEKINKAAAKYQK